MEAGQYWLWEQLVRHEYSVFTLATQLRRDVRDVARWCSAGVPHAYAEIVQAALCDVPERCFVGLKQLPVGWMPVAKCDGDRFERRAWLEEPGALLSVATAMHLDAMGYGAVMHRPIGLVKERYFSLEFHLIRGGVGTTNLHMMRTRETSLGNHTAKAVQLERV